MIRWRMPIPSYQKFMLSLLEFASDAEEHSIQETYSALADIFALTDSDRREFLPSGTQEIDKNRIGWARSYLAKAGRNLARSGSFS